MRAMTIERLGDQGAVRTLADPHPAANEVLIAVTAAGVNPIDWKTRDRGERKLPFVLGQDFAGVVADVGADVRPYRPGDRVFGMARERGSYAERTIVPQTDRAQPIAPIPKGLSDVDAAALPTAGLTALAALDALDIPKGGTLLILGVTGGVGGFAAQLALDRDLRVVGVAHSDNEMMASSIGVREFIAYDREDPVTGVLARYPSGVDGVLDLVNNTEKSGKMIEVIKQGGRIVSTIGALDAPTFAKRSILATNLVLAKTSRSSSESLTELAEMVVNGRMKVMIESEPGLEDAAGALKQSASGRTNGKIVVIVQPGKLHPSSTKGEIENYHDDYVETA